MSAFSTRPFTLPKTFFQDCVTAQENGRSLTPVLHRHAGKLGDYGLARQWQSQLTKKANWVGNTMQFAVVMDFHAHEKAGSRRHRQVIIQRDGVDSGYYRLHCLTKDTPNYRRDCARLQETLIANLDDLWDWSLFQYMYGHAAKTAAAADKSRLITEIGVGLTQQRFRAVARTISQLKDKSGLSDNDQALLQRAKRCFYRDWVGMTVKFIRAMDLTINDIMVTRPVPEQDEVTSQLRISRKTKPGRILHLQPFQSDKRDCSVYRNMESLGPLRARLNTLRRNAADKYKIPATAP